MESNERKSLTESSGSGIIPTQDELRILNNLRIEAAEMHFGEIDVTLQVYKDVVQYGQITSKKRRL